MLACTLLTTASLLGLALALGIDLPLSAWTRVGVGLALGQVGVLWLPFALAASYDLGARAAGLWACALLSVGCVMAAVQLSRSPQRWRGLAAQLRAAKAVPLTCGALLGLFGYLQLTHYVMPRADGLHTAGVTWGDLPIHLALATRFLYADGLARLEHPLFLGGPLSYPFLPDYSVATLSGLGLSLRWAFIVAGLPPFAALLLLVHGVTELWLDTRDVRPSLLALALFLFAGGLGVVFLVADVAHGAAPLAVLASRNATYIDPFVLKSGHIGNLFIAARTAVFGMPIGAAALLLLGHAFEHPRPQPAAFLCAGGLIGALPLVHGHSFLVLCIAGAWYAGCFARTRLSGLLACSALLAVCAAPQLYWLSSQGAVSSLRLSFGMLQPAASPGLWLRDLVLDLGLWTLAVPLGLYWASPRTQRLAAPLLVLLPLANVLTFTPAAYDNVKLLAWFDLGAAPLVAATIMRLGQRWPLSAAGIVLGCTLSGALAVAYELRSDALVVSHAERDFADFVRGHTRPGDVIATAASYQDPIALFAGRRVLIATPAMLATHGIAVGERARDLVLLYRGGAPALAVIERFGVQGVVVGPEERADLPWVDERFLRAQASAVYTQGPRSLYLLRRLDSDAITAVP